MRVVLGVDQRAAYAQMKYNETSIYIVSCIVSEHVAHICVLKEKYGVPWEVCGGRIIMIFFLLSLFTSGRRPHFAHARAGPWICQICARSTRRCGHHGHADGSKMVCA